jgi:hypothetical protein
MYFTLIVGILNAMRWMITAASCLLIGARQRPGISIEGMRRTQQS